jgi:two-component system sensor histidine kinase DegS
MGGARQISVGWLTRTVRKPGFWIILVMLVLFTILHYGEALKYPAFLTHLTANLGLERHAFERTLYLAPIVWAGFLFGWRSGFVTSLVALICMLPRAIFISPHPKDALVETSVIFIIANVIAVGFASLRREREYRTQLEVAHQELQKSEQRYRELFENAHDAIWLHALDGNIIAGNRATVMLTGYDVKELQKLNAVDLLSEDDLEITRNIEQRLVEGEDTGSMAEVKLIRKDKSEAFIQLATSVVFDKGKPIAFQHIARDISEQKRLQENLHFYLQQATRAQEEERKRISHELHDETIQGLVVLSRQLDALASGGEGLSEDNRLRLEELLQQVNNVIQGVRRLSQDLRPAALDRLGLLATLEWLASDVTEYSGIATKVNVLGRERRLPEDVELVLFRITQEALRNVWRHSEATKAEITVEFDQSKTRIIINDNGKGFDLPQTIGDLARDGKLGLAGMQERARLVGGTLTVQSQPGRGCSITIELPA